MLKVLQNLGRVDKTTDDTFKQHVANFSEQQVCLSLVSFPCFQEKGFLPVWMISCCAKQQNFTLIFYSSTYSRIPFFVY